VKSLTGLALLFLAAAGPALASDPVAVYALVDKVVLEPNADQPERIQVWGVFSVAQPGDRNFYQSPARGYLYLQLPAGGQRELAKREWLDIKSAAGKRQVLSFGTRFGMNPRLRKKDEAVASPDTYSAGMGATKLRSDTDYAPIRTLLDYRD
jgi:hypothetical protein